MTLPGWMTAEDYAVSRAGFRRRAAGPQASADESLILRGDNRSRDRLAFVVSTGFGALRHAVDKTAFLAF